MTILRNRRFQILSAFLTLLAAGLLVSAVFSQRRGGGNRFAAMELRAIAEPFVGVATEEGIQKDLFSIRSTGVSTKPVLDAARVLLDSLSGDQRKRSSFPVDDAEWRRWANQHSLPRQGVSFEEMNESQREAAFALMKAGLSAKGFQRSRDIMRLNYTLGEITSNFEELDEWFYYLTFMGEPSKEQPWGWQLDGHHLIVNYFVMGDQVVMTPTFMGSEPVIAESGKYKGVSVMHDEMNRGLDLMRALDEGQRSQAVLETSKTGNNNLAEAFSDNVVLDYAGIRGDQLSGRQRELLLALVEEFVGNMADGHAKVKMDEVRKHLDETYLAWIGGFDTGSVFYYRVHSPVVLIEFDHQRPIFMPLPRRPNLQHVHSIIRTPNGNDYGKDLLRQHYEQSHRSALNQAIAALHGAGSNPSRLGDDLRVLAD